MLVLKKRWQVTAANITIFVDGSGQNTAAILMVPLWVIGSTTKKGNSKWSFANDHLINKCIRLIPIYGFLGAFFRDTLDCHQNKCLAFEQSSANFFFMLGLGLLYVILIFFCSFNYLSS